MGDEHLISLQPGTVIGGRYEVVKCLGAGSMGLVYACRHRELANHLVAIKVLFPEVAQDKVAAQRFQNEIAASYNVSHVNVVRAYEYIRDGDIVAYTMEFVGGGDLAHRLSQNNDPIPVLEVVRLLSQMCAGVQAIHDAGIVHRDLKPENILLTKDGNVKIADFGIARTDKGPRLTEHGGVVGTLDYVSPEYMLNSQVDWRSDVYALGILGYEMICGESPFRADSVYATMTKRLKTDPPPPSSKRPECSTELDRIILKAMQRNPEERYQSAAEMNYDLQQMTADPATKVAPTTPSQPAPPIAHPPALRPRSVSVRDDFVDRPSRDRSFPTPEEMYWSRKPVNNYVPRVESPTTRPTAKHTFSLGPDEDIVGTTHVLNPESSGAASEYQQSFATESARMERLLAGSGATGSGVWKIANLGQSASGVRMRVGIDQKRVQRLSSFVDAVNRSAWLDAVTLLVAVLIAVGLAFAFLKVFYPEALGANSIPQYGEVRVV